MKSIDSLRAQLNQEGIDTSTLRSLAEERPHAAYQTSYPESEWIYLLNAPGSSDLDLWQHLRRLTPLTEYMPVVLAEYDFPNPYTDYSLNDVFEAADALDGKAWLDEQWQGYFDTCTAEGTDPYEIRSAWPLDELYDDRFESFIDAYSTTILRTTQPLIALLPTLHNWEIPAYLLFGDVNSCPEPAVHVAVHHYWQLRYQSEIVLVAYDSMCCMVGEPPENRHEALALATEQFSYCEDLIFRDNNKSLEYLASRLMNGSGWYFWWASNIQ